MNLVLDFDNGRDLALGLLPELILTLWAMLLCLHAAWRHKEPGAQRQTGWLALAGIVLALGAAIWMWTRKPELAGVATVLAVDGFRWAMTIIILVGAALSTILAVGYLDREGINIPEYHAMIVFATIGMLFMVSGTDLLVIFLGLETMSVAVYVLAAMDRRSAWSAEAGLKYFLLGAFASAFLLYGIALLYGATATTKLPMLGFQIASVPPSMNLVLMAGIGMLVIGFGFKIAAVPFHMWAPDVYDGAPSPVTAFMAATVKTAAFGAFARVLVQGLIAQQHEWAPVLWWLAAATMVVGNLLALAQRSLKRMLAYSSVAHAGYLLAALVPGSIAGVRAILFYLMFYTLATLAAFTILIARGRKGERDVTTDDLSGLAESDPMLAFIMAVSMLSLLGFPGTAGFIGKWFVLATATGGGYASIAVVVVLTSIVSAGYYLPVIMAMYMKPRLHEQSHAQTLIPGVVRGVMLVAVLVTLFFGIWPGKALNVAAKGSNSFLTEHITTARSR